MQMQQIEYFLALCQELSFTRAARRCNISQPSLTNAIKALEVEMAGPLFSRKPQIGLTSFGRVMRPYFARIARDAENVRQMARLLTKVAPEGAKLHRRGPTQAIGLANGVQAVRPVPALGAELPNLVASMNGSYRARCRH